MAPPPKLVPNEEKKGFWLGGKKKIEKGPSPQLVNQSWGDKVSKKTKFLENFLIWKKTTKPFGCLGFYFINGFWEAPKVLLPQKPEPKSPKT